MMIYKCNSNCRSNKVITDISKTKGTKAIYCERCVLQAKIFILPLKIVDEFNQYVIF